MDAANNILVCGHSNAVSLVDQSAWYPVMAYMDPSGNYFWQNKYATTLSSHSFSACAFRQDTNTRIIGVTRTNQNIIMINGVDGVPIKSWSIQGQNTQLTYYHVFYDTNDDFFLPGKGGSGALNINSFNLDTGNCLFVLVMAGGYGQDVKIEGGKFYMSYYRGYQHGFIRGAWPSGAYEFMFEFTFGSATHWYEPKGIDVKNGFLCMCSDRHDQSYIRLHTHKNADTNNPDDNDYWWAQNEVSYLWNQEDPKTCGGIHIVDDNNIVYLFSLLTNLRRMGLVKLNLITRVYTMELFRDTTGFILFNSVFKSDTVWTAIGYSDNTSCMYAQYNAGSCVGTDNSYASQRYISYTGCNPGPCYYYSNVAPGNNDQASCVSGESMGCYCIAGVWEHYTYGSYHESYLTNYEQDPILTTWMNDVNTSVRHWCYRRLNGVAIIRPSNAFTTQCVDTYYSETGTYDRDNIVHGEYIAPNIVPGDTYDLQTRTLQVTTAQYQAIESSFEAECPTNYEITAQPASPWNHHYLVSDPADTHTITGWAVETGCTDAFKFVVKYVDAIETLTMPAQITNSVKSSNTVAFIAQTNLQTDAGITHQVKIYPTTFNYQKGNTIIYYLHIWYFVLDTPKNDEYYIITDPTKTLTMSTYTVIAPPTFSTAITFTVTYQGGGALPADGRITYSNTGNQLYIYCQSNDPTESGYYNLRVTATINGGMFTNIQQDFTVRFLAVTPNIPTITDQTYHIKDAAIAWNMARFSLTFTPNDPPANTWTYTFLEDDYVTAGPAFIPEVMTGGNPAITFTAQSNTNAVYFAKAGGIYNLAVRAVNSLGFTYYTDFTVTILPFKTITAPAGGTYYYQVGDPVQMNTIAGAYSVDISTTEDWTYTLAGALGPITITNHQNNVPDTGGIDFHTITSLNAEAAIYPFTVTATLDTGETNSDYDVTIVIQYIDPPVVADVLYYVRDPTHRIEVPKFDIYPQVVGETLSYQVRQPDMSAIDLTVYTPIVNGNNYVIDPPLYVDIYTIDNSKRAFYDFMVTLTTSNGLVSSELFWQVEIRWFVVITPPYVHWQAYMVEDDPFFYNIDYFVPSPTDYLETWEYTITQQDGTPLPSFMKTWIYDVLSGPVIRHRVYTMDNDFGMEYNMIVTACIENGKFCASTSYDLYVNAKIMHNEFAPLFDSTLSTVTMMAGKKESYKLPGYSDGDNHKIEILGFENLRDGLMEFVKIDSASGTVTFEPGFDKVGTYRINIMLTDNGELPLSSNNQFTLIVEENTEIEEIEFWNQAAPISEDLDVWIDSISNTGVARVKFNAEMYSHSNYTFFNDERAPVLGLRLYSQYYSEYQDEKIEDWYIVGNGSDYIDIKITWSDARSISIFSKNDELEIEFINNQMFREASTGFALKEDQYRTRQIPTQIPYDGYLDSLMNFANAMGVIMNILIFGTLAASIFLNGSLQYLWIMINAQQLMLHTGLLTIMFPQNAQFFMGKMIKVANFDVLPAFEMINDIFTFESILPENSNFEQMNYETMNFLQNMRSLFFIGCFAIMGAILVLVMTPFFKACKKGPEAHKKLHQAIFFNIFLRYAIEAYIVFAISNLINFKAFDWGDSGENFGALCSMVSCVVSVALPIGTLYILMANQASLAAGNNRFTSLYSGLRPESKWSLAYYFIFFVRRYIFALVCAFLVEEQVYQIQVYLMMATLVFIYLIAAQPFKGFALNFLDTFNEACVIGVGLCLVPLSDAYDDYLMKWDAGWALLAIIVANMFVNIFFLIRGLKESVLKCLKEKRDAQFKRGKFEFRPSENLDGTRGALKSSNWTDVSPDASPDKIDRKVRSYDVKQPSNNKAKKSQKDNANKLNKKGKNGQNGDNWDDADGENKFDTDKQATNDNFNKASPGFAEDDIFADDDVIGAPHNIGPSGYDFGVKAGAMQPQNNFMQNAPESQDKGFESGDDPLDYRDQYKDVTNDGQDYTPYYMNLKKQERRAAYNK